MSSAENGQVVVITGANEGIGYHVATALLDRGYRVAGLDVDGTNVQSLQETHPNRVQFYRCDVTVDGDVRTAVDEILDRWGRIDILVNNAAIFNFAPFENQTLADTKREFEVNYFGYVRTIRPACRTTRLSSRPRKPEYGQKARAFEHRPRRRRPRTRELRGREGR